MTSKSNIFSRKNNPAGAGRHSLVPWIAGLLLLALSSCKIYSFNDASVPPDIKTIRINFIENRAPYINPQLSPQLTDKLKQKVNNQTRLTLIQGDNADYDVSATVTNYSESTSGISSNSNGSNKQAATNRLTIGVHVVVKNNHDPSKSIDTNVSRNFDFSANLSLQQAEASLMSDILQNLTDDIFNSIFSNW